MSQIEDRLHEIAKFAQTQEDVTALRQHLREVLAGPAFHSSRRSGQFLEYVVEQALLQRTDALKERTIGVEVFQRAPDYDTGEDAIVRVTASDVRRRLAQHYSGIARGADFRISLPPGGYVPEIDRTPPVDVRRSAPPVEEPPVRTDESQVALRTAPHTPPVQDSPVPDLPVPHFLVRGQSAPGKLTQPRWRTVVFGLLAVVLFLGAGFLLAGHRQDEAETLPEPWTKLFHGGEPVPIILADPDLNEIQLLTRHYVPLSDYAKGKLGCDSLPPDLQRVCVEALRGDKVAEVDANALVHIARIGTLLHSHVEAHASRSMRLPDLQGDRSFVILGSKVADPWADLYRSRTEFYIDHDPTTGLQVVYDQHPRPGEPAMHVPSAGPYGTGESYALISFVRNLSGNGYALLLAGCTHEGMDAAVSTLTNKRDFEEMVHGCGISASKPFQVLLRLHMMAGSTLTTERLACRQLG